MSVHAGHLKLQTEADADLVDITDGVAEVVATSGIAAGVATVFAEGSTAAVTTMEYERGGVHDLVQLLDRLVPERAPDGEAYEHNRLNHDSNSHAHQRASLVGPSVSVPVRDGRLTLGTWQQIVYCDFDDRARSRTVLVQVVG